VPSLYTGASNGFGNPYGLEGPSIWDIYPPTDTVDIVCGSIWSSSLMDWMKTASTTEIALVSPSIVYNEVAGTMNLTRLPFWNGMTGLQ
jgi:hypothetical protein